MTFVGRPPPVPRELAVPLLIVAGILLILAGTSTGIGRALASTFGVIQTLYNAGENAIGFIAIPFAIIIFLIMVRSRAGICRGRDGLLH